jgi:uncharacterized delta-60 repeat protein
MLRTWLPRLAPRRPRPSQFPRGRARPGVERLEDRTLLSAGTLDLSFGTGGTGAVVTSQDLGVHGNAAVLQPDGKIVVVGDDNQIVGANLLEWTVERYNPDGTPDPSFHVPRLLFPTSAIPTAVAVEPDGKIVVAGFDNAQALPTWELARFNADCSLDTTFNAHGLQPGTVSTTFPNQSLAQAFAVGIETVNGQPKIVAGALAIISNVNEVALARYNLDGTLDTTFGSGGLVASPVAGANGSQANSLVIQPDGKIVAAGFTLVGTGANVFDDFLVTRYNADGSLDRTFGGTGQVLTPFAAGANAEGHGAALEADGKVVVAGQTDNGGGTESFALARYDTQGNLDSSFGTGGRVVTDLNNNSANAVAIQADGRIVAAGSQRGVPTAASFALVRYNHDGTIDTTFNGIGIVITNFGVVSGGQTSLDQANAVLLRGDGKVVAVGTTQNPGGTPSFALARYENDRLQFSASNFSVSESGGSATVTVTRVAGVRGTVSATFSTDSGVVVGAGADIVPVTTTVTFNEGQTSKTVHIPVVAEAFVDGNETVTLTLSNARGAALGTPATAVLTIEESPIHPIVDVTPFVSVTIRRLGRSRQLVTLTNTGSRGIYGPFFLVLDNLPHNKKGRPLVTLVNASGATQVQPPVGSPFVMMNLPVLGPGQSQTVALVFSANLAFRKARRAITYTPRVLAGTGAV